jgi:transposase
VARQVDVTPSLIYRWRRDLRAAANGFAQVLVAPAGDGVAAPAVPAIDIELPGHARVRIPASVPPALAAAVVEALARR